MDHDGLTRREWLGALGMVAAGTAFATEDEPPATRRRLIVRS